MKRRVLLISHTCQSRGEGQPRAHALGALPDLELSVLVPDRWKRYGAWRAPQTPLAANFDFQIGHIALPWSGPGQTYLHFYPALPALLRRWRPDIIDVWEEPWSLAAAQTCFWRDRLLPRAKIVIETEQNLDKLLPPPFESLRAYVLRRADFLIGRSRAAVQVAQRKGFRGPSQVVPNAVDIALFAPQNRALCRQKLDLSGFVAGYAGRLTRAKGVFDLLDALPHCAPEVRLLFIGAGPDEDELRARAAAYGGRVRFLGARPLHELPPLFGALDALVLPSRTTASWQEQFGRVLIEAGACGVPVVGSSSGAIPEVIGAGDAAMGLIFPEGDARALSQALETLRLDLDLAQRLGCNGARRAHDEFSWEQIAARLARIYRALV